MKTDSKICLYAENLDRKEQEIGNEVLRYHQLHQLYPDTGHKKSRVLAKRQLLAVRAKAAVLE